MEGVGCASVKNDAVCSSDGDVTPIRPGDLRMKNFVLRFIKDEDGQDLIEYALLAALIALAAITAMQALGGAINQKFSDVSTSLGKGS